MLTQKLLAVTNLGADWVLWLLVALSVISVAIVLERALFFATRRLTHPDEISAYLLAGDPAGGGPDHFRRPAHIGGQLRRALGDRFLPR